MENKMKGALLMSVLRVHRHSLGFRISNTG
jgi:hypothetical protein